MDQYSQPWGRWLGSQPRVAGDRVESLVVPAGKVWLLPLDRHEENLAKVFPNAVAKTQMVNI